MATQSLFEPTHGIIDCHFHVIGDGVEFPYAPDRAYEPEPAPYDRFVAFHERSRIRNAVLVQVSVYGTDNGLLLETLQNDPTRLRGIAVTNTNPGDRHLAKLKDSGIVGLRLNVMHGGGPNLAQIDRYAALCLDMGLHLQIYLDGRLLPDLMPVLMRLKVPLVLDHFGGIPTYLGLEHPSVTALLQLLEEGAWVKLSAPYRVSSSQSLFTDTLRLGRKLVESAPDRCLWGSDWPHVATDKVIETAQLLQLAYAMMNNQVAADKVFFSNADQLYGFNI